MSVVTVNNPKVIKKLMNLRITTLADIIIFDEAGKFWNDQICNTFPSIIAQLPQCPAGLRALRIG